MSFISDVPLRQFSDIWGETCDVDRWLAVKLGATVQNKTARREEIRMIDIANKHMDHTVSLVELLVLFFNFEVCVHPTLTSQLVY